MKDLKKSTKGYLHLMNTNNKIWISDVNFIKLVLFVIDATYQ